MFAWGISHPRPGASEHLCATASGLAADEADASVPACDEPEAYDRSRAGTGVSRCPGAGTAIARRTWSHPCPVPHRAAEPGRTRPRPRPGVRPAAAGRPGRLEPQGPPGLAACPDLGELDLAPGSLARSRAGCPDCGQRARADPPVLLYSPPAGRVADVQTRRVTRKGPLLPGFHPAAGTTGHLEDSRASPVCLDLEGAARADLDRQPRQIRVEQVEVLIRLQLGGEAGKPSRYPGVQGAGKDPAHLKAAHCPGHRAVMLYGHLGVLTAGGRVLDPGRRPGANRPVVTGISGGPARLWHVILRG